MNASIPSVSAPPFDDAHRKIAAYLRLCGLAPAVADRVSASLVEKQIVARSDRDDLTASPVVAGTLDTLDTWAATLVPAREGESTGHRGVRGRAKMFLTGLPTRWPDAFLTPAQPPELQAALAIASPQLVPDVSKSVMAPQPLDLGSVSKVADETWRTFDKWPFLRGLSIWVLFFLLLGGAFYLVRF